MHRFIGKMDAAVRHPYLEIVLAVILVVCGFMEAGENIMEDISKGEVGAHHGVILLGIAHAVKAIPSLLASFMLFADVEDSVHREHKED